LFLPLFEEGGGEGAGAGAGVAAGGGEGDAAPPGGTISLTGALFIFMEFMLSNLKFALL
jgi:hypothetical protein